MAFRVRKHGELEFDEVDVTPAPATATAAAPAADPGRATTPEAQVPNGTPESANLRGGGPSDR